MIETGYTPQSVEGRWYQAWLEAEAFRAEDTSSRPPFCIVIPPPNVTGSLHMGHALNSTLQDILVRWKRMEGSNTLWMPGTDHAGIATQNVVERVLAEKGKNREELGREKFVEEAKEWSKRYEKRILGQLKKLGASCDWDRTRFTFDEGLSKAVRQAFVRLYEDHLIYRGERLVNWCPRCDTALSDIEVQHEEVDGRLWHVRYVFEDKPDEALIVATTRPETILGDTAVAVHPEDERYQGAIGRKVLVPVVNRKIPVIADPFVSMEFGTGALKITPGHDFNDHEIGVRHELPIIKIFTSKGQLSPEFLVDNEGKPLESERAEKYLGEDHYKVRKLILKDLEELRLSAGEEPHRHSVGHCYRCQTAVEPFLTPQWFVATKQLAEPAIRAVEEGRTKIVPETWTKTYFEWMRNIKDWCISRQIWWGHQIPAWYCLDCNKGKWSRKGKAVDAQGKAVTETADGQYIFFQDAEAIVSLEDPTECPKCEAKNLVRDPDVLDTWFSSSLWPFSTLGWPEDTSALKTFYPTSVLVTAFDILFFWVARMMMMGLKFMGEVPFREVYIHALVRDPEGQKMSKSRGNVIDPVEIIDKQGADAFRFTLSSLAAQGRDIRISGERIEGYRHFCNKIWNAARFCLSHLGENPPDREAALLAVRKAKKGDSDSPVRPADHWILSCLHRTTRTVREALESYRFNEASSVLYQFMWHQFCDWYLEETKHRLADKKEGEHVRALLAEVLETSLRLLHPFMPFMTEELWQRLPKPPGGPSLLALAPYPEVDERFIDEEAERPMGLLIEAITGVRNIFGEMDIHPRKKFRLSAQLRGELGELGREVLEKEKEFFVAATNAEAFSYLEPGQAHPPVSATDTTSWGDFIVDLKGLLDFGAERERISKKLAAARKDLEAVQRRLDSPQFEERAPAEVVQETRARRDTLVELMARLEGNLARVTEWEKES